jgi:hypothetical protein
LLKIRNKISGVIKEAFMTLTLTESMLTTLAPSEQALHDGKNLTKKLKNLAKSEDNSLLFGQCQGSGKNPYELSIDLNTGADHPTMRCNCPSRQHPCKHVLGFAHAFVSNPNSFTVRVPPQDLLDKRQKLADKNAKKEGGDTTEAKATTTAEAKAPVKKGPNKEAQRKKAEGQKEALETLEKFTIDLVTAGVGGLSAKQIKSIQDQSNRVSDADLPGPRDLLRKLANLVQDDDLSLELKQARMGLLLTQLWATVRKGQKLLEEKLEEGDSKADNDAFIESVLGRKWLLPDLIKSGYAVTERSFLELAHERTEDKILENRLTTGYLLDLDDGSIPMERTIIPYQALHVADIKHRLSRPGVFHVKEAALYPTTALNRRVRWNEKDFTLLTERARAADDYAKVHKLAKPLDASLKAYKEQLKNILLPQEAVVLVASAQLGLSGKQLTMVDAAGQRLTIKDPAQTQYPTSDNLLYAAGSYGGSGSLVVRLWFDLLERSIFGQALAFFVGETHLRLGL